MRSIRTAAPAMLAAVIVLTLTRANAAPGVAIGSAVASGTTVAVDGTASFTGAGLESVGGSNVNFSDPELSTTAGIDLVDALIEPIGGGLRFVWQMSTMPPVVPPEGVRYTWAFQIDGVQFQLQAKQTNLASTTTLDDPEGHVQQLAAGPYFQLRGNCTTMYMGTPVAGCFHLAFLEGSFDPANARVSIDLPFGIAPEIQPGAVIQELLTAGMSITASFQAVVSNTSTSDYINGWDPYFAGPVVQLGLGPSTAFPQFVVYTATATLDGVGGFSGSVDGLGGANDTVFVRACEGTLCAYASQTV